MRRFWTVTLTLVASCAAQDDSTPNDESVDVLAEAVTSPSAEAQSPLGEIRDTRQGPLEPKTQPQIPPIAPCIHCCPESELDAKGYVLILLSAQAAPQFDSLSDPRVVMNGLEYPVHSKGDAVIVPGKRFEGGIGTVIHDPPASVSIRLSADENTKVSCPIHFIPKL